MNVADTLNERSGPSELETRADSAKQGVASSNFVKNGAISVVENGHANGLNQPARRRSLRSQDLDLSEEDDDGEAPLYFSTREGKKPMGKVLEIMKERADFRNPFAEGRQALGGLQMLSGGASETGGSKVGANGSSQTGVVVVGSEDSSRSLNGQNLNLAGRLAESLSKRSQRGKESRLRGEKAAGVNFINDLRVSDSEEDEPPPLIRRRRAVSTVEEKKVQERRADSKPERDGWRARKGAEGQVNCSSADPEASGSAGNVGGEGGLSHSALGAEESQHATGGVGTDTQTSEAGGRWGEEEGVKKGTEQERTGGLTAVRKGTISKSETGGEGSSQSLRHEEAAASVAERSGKNEVRGVEGGVRKQASVLDEKTSGLEVLMTEAGRERRDGNDGKLLPGAKVGDVRSGAGNVGALRRQGVEGPPRTGAESGGPERSEVRGGGGVVPEEKIPGGATFKPVAEEGTRGRADESGGWRTRKVSPSQDSVHFEGGVNARHSSNPAGAVGTREGPAALRNGPIEPGPSNLKPGENVSEEESKGPGDRKRLDKSKGPDAPSLGGASSVPETVAPWSRQLSSRLPRQSLSGEPSTVLSEDSWRDARASGTHAESEVRSNPGLERFKEDRSLQVPFLGPQGDFKRTERGLVGELFEGGEGAGNVQEESNGQRRRRPVILDDSEEIAKPGVERMGNSNGLEVGRNGLGMGEVSLRRRQRPNLSLDSSLSDEEEPTPLVRRRNRFGGASRTEPICQNNGGGPQSDGSIKLGVSRSNHVPAAAEGARSRQAPAGPELVHIPESPEDENGPLSPTKRRRSARHRRGVLGGGTASLQNSEPAGLTGVGHAERRGQWDSAQLRKGAGDGASGTASEKRDGSTEFASQERVAVGRGDGLEEDAGAVEGQQTRRFPLGGLGELESVAGERRAETSDSERASQALPGGNRGALGLTAANEVGTEALNLAEEGENFSRPSFWTRRRQGTEAAQRSRGVRGAFVRPRGRTSEGGLGFGDLESEEQRRGGFSQVGALDSEGSIERRGVTVAGRDAGLPGVSALRGLRLAGARQEQTGGLLPGLASASVVENEERGAAVANPGPLQIDDLESGRLAAGSGGLTQNKKQAAETLSDRALAGAGRFDRRNGLARIGLSQEPGLSGPSGAGRFGNAVGASGDSARIEVGGSSEGGAGDRNNGLELRSGGVGVSSELDEDEDVPIAAQRSRRAKRRRSETRPAPPEIVDLDGSDEEEVLGHRSRVRRRGPAGRGLEVPGEGLGRASAREALGVPEEGPGFLGGRVRARGRSLGGRGGISEDPGTHLGLGERLEVPQEGLGVRPRPRGPEVRGGEPGGSLEVPGSRDEDARRRAQLEEDERLARELQRREEIEASDTLTRVSGDVLFHDLALNCRVSFKLSFR